MAYELKDNSGSLFKNDRKEADTHADYNGTVMIDGTTYWINAWLKDGGKGKFFSLSFKPKAQAAQEIRERQSGGTSYDGPSGGSGAGLDDDIPFAAEWRL